MKVVNNINELIEELGVSKGSTVEIRTPQFERTYDLEINFIPEGKYELDMIIKTAPKDVLKKMGVRVWSEYENEDEETHYMNPGDIHYLFPGEWYENIPEGYDVVDICGDSEKFIQGETDNDIRFGCLAYGFIRNF